MTSSRALDHRARRQRNQDAILPSSWFSTRDLSPAERFPAWHESMNVCLQTSQDGQFAGDRFNGEIEGYLLDDITFTRVRANRQKFDRKSLKIARDGIDHYMIELFFRGHTEMTVHRRVIRNQPGQIMGFDLGDVMDSFNSDFDLLCIFVPRPRLAPLLVKPDSLHGLLPSVEDGPGLLLSEYMKSLWRVLPLLTPDEARPSARALIELLAAAFNRAAAGARWDGTAPDQSLLLRAQKFIRENIRAPDLSAEKIAREIGVSRTALYALFEPMGGVTSHMRELRLRKCLAEITAPSNVGASVWEIAHRWGFSSHAVFSRAFRHRFGVSPSDARAAALARARSVEGLIDSRTGNRRHEEWILGLF